MKQKTMELACSELKKYHGEAELKLDPSLPSFEIRRVDGKSVILAPDEVELLYGVYDYAEHFLGWCFFEPGQDRFSPEEVRSSLPDGVLVPARKPLLKRRGFIQEFPFDSETPDLIDWMAKNKLNYLQTWMKYYDALALELKEMAQVRGIEIESGHHNFDYWIPGDKYGETHPEFFAEINGRRISPSSGKSALLLSEQLCTTNPELRNEMSRNILKYCAGNPEVKTIAVIPNDGFGWCECERCSSYYDKNRKGDLYSVSEHVYKADRIYHDLVRDIAERVHKVRPDVNVAFCAYVNYCGPSEGFVLGKGIVLHMAPYWRCINHPIDDPACPINSRYARDILDWAAVKRGGELNIYEYYMGVNFYLSLPMIHFREMFREIRWYSDHQVDGILTQFHLTHWTVYGINYSLMGKAARGEEETAAIEELFRKLFGNDAPEARQFYDRIKKLLLDAGHCHIPYPYSLLSRSSLSSFEEIYSLAVELAKSAPEDRFRQELILWTDYMRRFKTLFDEYRKGNVTENDVKGFLFWIHRHQDSRVFVHPKFDMLFGAWIRAIQSGKEWIHFNLDWEDAYIRRHREILG